jgi:hypothetical protein
VYVFFSIADDLVKAQLKALVDAQHFGDAKNQTSILLYPKLVDPEHFISKVLVQYTFEEDKQEIKDALGL